MADVKGSINTAPIKLVDLGDGSFAIATTATVGDITVPPATAATATLTSVASSATTVSLLASNTSRKGAAFFNDSTQTLFIAFAATASTTAFTVKVLSQGYYELPTTATYTGAISGIWASANGSVRITELS